MAISDTSWLTGGLDVGTDSSLEATLYGTILTDGMPVELAPPLAVPNTLEGAKPNVFGATVLTGQQLQTQLLLSSLRDVNGRLVIPDVNGFIDVGAGHRLEFDDETLAGRISPAFAAEALNTLDVALAGGTQSFTGSEIRLMVEVAEPSQQGDSRKRYAKQLLECTTLSVSVHREKAPVRAAGYINPKGFARGKRTIAGTIILTQFTAEVLLRFLQSVIMQDTSKDTHYMKVDQLPPFNITIFMSNEQGFASYRRLLGVEFVTDGVTYSIQDMLSEQQISYMAADFTPLLPLTLSSLYSPVDASNPTTKREKVASDLGAKYAPKTTGDR